MHGGDGAALLDALPAQGAGGLVAQRTDAPYRPGRSAPDWVVVRA